MRTVPLGDLIRPAGRRAKSGNELPVYSVTKHSGFVPSLEYFKKQVFSREIEGYKMVEAGDFAYATIHLDEGSIGVAPEPALISPMYTVFRTDETQVDTSYLLRFLKSPRALTHYPQLGKGAVHRRKAISLQALSGLPVPLPPLPEQRRVAAILDHADALRAKRRRSTALLDDLAATSFDQFFGGANHPRLPFGELVEFMRNGLSPTAHGTLVVTVLTLSAISGGAFDAAAVKEGTFSVDPPASVRLDARDFLICRGNGNKNLVGVGVRARASRADVVFPDTMIGARIRSDRLDPGYLEAAWKQPAVRRQIQAGARTTSGIHKINQQLLRSVLIPLPDLVEQRALSKRLATIETQHLRARRALERLDEFFQSLQSRAFSGGLTSSLS